MTRFLFALACIPLVASLIIAGFYLMNAQPVSALLSVVCGVMVTGTLVYAYSGSTF
jgi:hypothetical protein